MILTFDLDDTLYDELTYVQSGFHAVARYLAQKYGLSVSGLKNDMWEMLERKGRGKIFDDTLSKYDVFSRTEVKNCLAEYRRHDPGIALYKEAKQCLQRFSGYTKYLVTDGNAMVQAKKIAALKLHRYFERTLITNRFGIRHQKPSPYCFQKICVWENTSPGHVVYIGDNPRKDFVGIKPLGFRTVQVLTGQHKDAELNKRYMAHVRIASLDELTSELLKDLWNG